MLVKMEEIIEQNRTLGQHLQLMEDRSHLDDRSVKFMEDAISMISSRRSLRSIASTAFPRARPSTSMSSRQVSVERWDLEIALQRSRVYSRSKSNQCDMSYTTSTAPTNAWSMLSGISLNDVSVVSAYRLPITLNHIHLVAPGSTFSAMFMESLPVPPEGKLKTATAQNLSYLKSAVGWNRQASKRSLTATSTETPKLTTAKTVRTPQTDVAKRVANAKSSVDFPKMKLVFYHEPRVGSCSLSCRVVVVGDSNALKSKMIHTFMSNAPIAADEDIPQGSDCSRNAVKYVQRKANLVPIEQIIMPSADTY